MMQISNECHIWRILDSLPSTYLALATALHVQKDNTINYVKKAVINFEGTIGKAAKAVAPGPQALATAGQWTDNRAPQRKSDQSRSQQQPRSNNKSH